MYIMSDVKSVIMLLCKHLSLSINISVKPECFRLSKYNESTEDTEQSLWTVLHALSFYAARDKKHGLSFEDYDETSATKLYLAFLRYPSIEFYGGTKGSGNTRELLLTLCWLLTTQNVLDVVIRSTLMTSILAREYSHTDVTVKKVSLSSFNGTCSSTNVQLRNIENCSSKIYFNVKQICELLQRKTKLTSKIHTASCTCNNVVMHPNVLEVALMKRLTTNQDNLPLDLDGLRLRELRRIRLILDTHIKWIEKEHIFYDWMISVTREHKRFLCTSVENSVDLNEAIRFYCLLRHILTKKLCAPTANMSNDAKYIGDLCALRLLKQLHGESDARNWLKVISVQLSSDEERLRKNEMELLQHLKGTLSSASTYIRI